MVMMMTVAIVIPRLEDITLTCLAKAYFLGAFRVVLCFLLFFLLCTIGFLFLLFLLILFCELVILLPLSQVRLLLSLPFYLLYLWAGGGHLSATCSSCSPCLLPSL